MPPIEFHKMLNGLSIDKDIIKRVNELIIIKSTVNESYFHNGEEQIIQFIENNINEAVEKANDLTTSTYSSDDFDDFFLKTIN
jgi:predicted nucleotidyltransferase